MERRIWRLLDNVHRRPESTGRVSLEAHVQNSAAYSGKTDIIFYENLERLGGIVNGCRALAVAGTAPRLIAKQLREGMAIYMELCDGEDFSEKGRKRRARADGDSER